jgi:Tfp pilus assembly protein PilO
MAGQLQTRDRRALLLLGAALALAALLQFDIFTPGAGSDAAAGSIEAAEQRLLLAQVRARQLPLAEAEFDAVRRQLDLLEQGLLKSETAALAQAEMRQLVGDLLASEGISMESSQFGTVQLDGEDYAQVPLNVNFQCGIEQLVNLMAAVANAPELLATRRIRVAPENAATKSVRVQLTVAGLLPVERTPELKRKAAGAGAGL